MKILLTVSYDGSGYCGWQRQKNGMSVQQKLEEALGEVFGCPGDYILVTGASRTDAGVHALGQCAAFFVEYCKIPLPKLPQVLNSKLPEDIVITSAREVDANFHPRFDAREKMYEYRISDCKYPSPLHRNFTWQLSHRLDEQKMDEAARLLIGTYDFAAFCAAGGHEKSTVRTIYDANVKRQGDQIIFSVRGNAFLYKMVRIITGTLVQAGRNKIDPASIQEIITLKERKLTGETAPPQGLTLIWVEYSFSVDKTHRKKYHNRW